MGAPFRQATRCSRKLTTYHSYGLCAHSKGTALDQARRHFGQQPNEAPAPISWQAYLAKQEPRHQTPHNCCRVCGYSIALRWRVFTDYRSNDPAPRPRLVINPRLAAYLLGLPRQIMVAWVHKGTAMERPRTEMDVEPLATVNDLQTPQSKSIAS